MSRVFIPKVISIPAPTGPKVFFETGSFVKWNKTGDKVFVVLHSQHPNMHEIRSLPSEDGLFQSYNANGENLTLIQTGNIWIKSPPSNVEKIIMEASKSEIILTFRQLMPGSPDQDLFRLFDLLKIKRKESTELILAYNATVGKELQVVQLK